MGEEGRADYQFALEFPTKLKTIAECRNYPPKLIFNVDGTELFWKRMPSRTFISHEGKSTSSDKPVKDHIIVIRWQC